MKPTAHLRFINRETQIFLGEDTYTFRMMKILQQWWASAPDSYSEWVMRVNGEWRDIELEQEQ